MRHVGGLGGVDDPFLVRRNRHALGLDPDRDLGDDRMGLGIRHGDEIVVLVGDVERVAGRIEHEQLRVRAAWQGVEFLVGAGIEDPHGVIVGRADIEQLAVGRDRDAARAVAAIEGMDDLPGRGVEHADGVVAFVRHERLAREGGGGGAGKSECQQKRFHGVPHLKAVHCDSGRSRPRVSSGETWCRNPSCGLTLTVMRPS